jgi:hypothetical protein
MKIGNSGHRCSRIQAQDGELRPEMEEFRLWRWRIQARDRDAEFKLEMEMENSGSLQLYKNQHKTGTKLQNPQGEEFL